MCLLLLRLYLHDVIGSCYIMATAGRSAIGLKIISATHRLSLRTLAMIQKTWLVQRAMRRPYLEPSD